MAEPPECPEGMRTDGLRDTALERPHLVETPLEPLAGFPVSRGCLQSLREADWSRVDHTHRFAPLIAFLRASNGDRIGGLGLARALAREPLQFTREKPDRAADLVIVRLWSARIEARHDREAWEVGRQLSEQPAALDPMRRALLHYELAIASVASTLAADPSVLDEATADLTTAVALARTIGFDNLAVAALSRLAHLAVPRGRLAAAERLCNEALALAEPATRKRMPHWLARTVLLRSWARYYQGHSVDQDEVAAAIQVLAARPETSILPLASAVAAIAWLEAGDTQAARQELQHALNNPMVAGLGVWRLPLLIVDGYLAIASGDAARSAECVAELTQVPAPAEALLLRAVQLAQVGDLTSAQAALRPVTTRSVRTLTFTFPVACALAAVLYEAQGAHEEADRSMRQALGTAEPLSALRVFSLHDSKLTQTILQRLIDAGPHSPWTRRVLEHVDEAMEKARGQHGYSTTGRIGQSRTEPTADVGSIIAMGSPLTEREMEVLALVNEGASQTRMAQELYVSLNTIKTHLRSIRKKLGVERTGEAAAVARKAGWLNSDAASG